MQVHGSATAIGRFSIRTVESHRSHIQQKLRRSSRADLVRYAIDQGLVEL